MLHQDLDRWLFNIESGDDFSAKTRRLAMNLERLRDKYYARYVKNTPIFRGTGRVPKLCKWRFKPPTMPKQIK